MNQGILNEPIYRDRLISDLKEWSVYRMHKNRDQFIEELNEIVLDYLKYKNEGELGELINKCIYKENVRLKNKPWKVDPPNERLFWKKIKKELKTHSNDPPEARKDSYSELLYRIINRYSQEIVGTFKIPTFKFARRFTTAFFGSIYNQAVKLGIPRYWWSKKKLLDKMKVFGEVDTCRSLFDKGTVVVVPTHSSNLDSIQIGFLLDFVTGFPHFSYGAGLNLYNSEIAAYFMNRLAAYRVDRRKKNQIYLETLKSMSQLAVQKGVNNLFFPGGTRSRSGEIESNLKKGLLSTLVEAQRNMLKENKDNKVIIVPLILSYHQVLEAPQLIDQHLRRKGREKYISSRPRGRNVWEIIKFAYRLMARENEIYAYFSHPIDVFGNKVNEKGESISKDGKVLDIKEYFVTDGEVTRDLQREGVYTQFLADKIAQKYHEDNIILSTQALAFFVFEYWQNENSQIDFFDFLRLPLEDFSLEIDHIMPQFREFVDALRQMAEQGRFHLEPIFAEAVEDIFSKGLNNIGIYHNDLPLYKDGNNCLRTESITTLYYYHNRLNGYDLEELDCFK